MKVSIITVCFNSVKTLDNTIDSVANQTYKDIEYIIIDGKSTDGTVELILKKEGLITKWVSEPDSGLYDAMNKGIALSTGELVGILNSDDVFNSNTVIQEIVAFHVKNEIMASIGNITQKDGNGKLIRFYSSHKWKPSKLKIGYMPPHPSIFFRRELFDNLGYYNIDFKIGADYELITRYFLKYNISWKYSGITTTAMLVGGLSSSGFSSYKIITKEIQKALQMNGVEFSSIRINLRAFWKILDFFKLNRITI
jgi:glycosyltransferase involved in cell wall biosynthesis